MKRLALVVAVACVWTAAALAARNTDERARLDEAAQVTRQVRPLIPDEVWSGTRCVAVIPGLKKAAFIVGGEYGTGVMSCRSGDSWTAPLFLQLAKGSWGFQAGAEEVDLVLLVMNENGVQKLLQDQVTLGAGASIAAGPVGRRAEAGTDVRLSAEILSYSRTRGVFAGLDLSGGVLKPDADANRGVYGANATPRTILASRGLSAPTEAAAFLTALRSASGTAASTAPVAASATGHGAPSAPGGVHQDVPANATLRTRVLDMQQTVDRMLSSPADENVVGTSGSANAPAAAVTVSRAELERLRQQLDAMLETIDKGR